MTNEEAMNLVDEALKSTNDLVMPDYPLTPTGKMLIRIYRQKLRDWPQTDGFPDPATMPQPEDWAKYRYDDTPVSPDIQG